MYVCIYIYNAFGSNVYMSPQYVHSKYYISLCDMRAISHKPGDQVKALGLGSGWFV